MEIFGYIAFFCVGFLLGVLGSGGSILAVPILVYLFSVDVVMATAYSLFVVGGSTTVGSLFGTNGNVIHKPSLFYFGGPSVLAVLLIRTLILPSVPEEVIQFDTWVLTRRAMLLGILALLMIGAAISMLLKKPGAMSKLKGGSPVWLILPGMVTGFLTGMVGIGGGFLIIPVLVFMNGLSFKAAVGTTLLIIMANSFFGLSTELSVCFSRWKLLISITGFAIAGILVGRRYMEKLPLGRLHQFFGWFTLLMAIFILVSEFIIL